jgi:hypothetical protein
MSASNENVGLWFSLLLAAGVFLYVSWDSKPVIAWRFDVDRNHLVVASKPHDCEFLTAPMGEKHCHYKLIVHRVLHSHAESDGGPIYSVDEGKTWKRFTYEMTPEELASDYPPNQTLTAAWTEWEKAAD